MTRHGKQGGTKEMIGLLQLVSTHGHDALRAAIESALATGCSDAAAVRHLLQAVQLRRADVVPIDVGALERYARPMPVMHDYDQLLTGVTGA